MFWTLVTLMCLPLTLRTVKVRKPLQIADMRLRDWRIQTYTGRVMEAREVPEAEDSKCIVSRVQLMTLGGVVNVSIPDFLISVFDRQTITVCEAVKQSNRQYFAVLNHDTRLVSLNDEALCEIAHHKVDLLLVLWYFMAALTVVGLALIVAHRVAEKRQRTNYTELSSIGIPKLWEKADTEASKLGYDDVLI